MSIFKEKVLAGKVAFVSGGTSGINLRIAERFAEHGAKVAVLGRKQEKLDAAVAQLRRFGGEVLGLAADVREYPAVEKALGEVKAKLGTIDVVVCGAAGNFPAPAIGMSSNAFRSVIEIDLLGTFHVCRAAFEHLRQPGAAVLNISAPQAYQPMALQSHVCAAKAGVDMLTKTLALEWGPAGIRVNALTPGPIDETEGMSRLAPTEEIREAMRTALPLGRFGTKDDIADLALFLCSDGAAYMTGGIYACDGGQSLVGSGGVMKALGF